MKTVLFLCLLALSVSVGAQGKGKSPAGGPCKADQEKLCKSAKKGEGRMIQCLYNNWGQVSTACKAQHQSRYDAWKKVQDGCSSDINKFCSASKETPADVNSCLRKNRKNLTKACLEAGKAMKNARMEHKKDKAMKRQEKKAAKEMKKAPPAKPAAEADMEMEESMDDAMEEPAADDSMEPTEEDVMSEDMMDE